MIDGTNVIYEEKKLSCCVRSDRVWYMTKTIKENDVTKRISLLYAKTETKLSWPV